VQSDQNIRPPRLEGTIVLAGGRHLGYAEFGPASGRPLVWLHGTPGARRQVPPGAREAAYQRGVRIVSVERPGIGASTPHLHDAVRDFAKDIGDLCNALDVDRFSVVGLSGGGPYALACAHEMPGRVVSAAVLGGVAPSVGLDRAEGGSTDMSVFFSPFLALTRRPAGALTQGLIRVLLPFADQAIDAFAYFMPPGDQRVFADEAVRRMFTDDLILGSAICMQALFIDGALFGRHWGFELGGIQVPVHMWYGDADVIVPLEHGEHMAARIPNAVLRTRPGEGHLGGLGASDEILDALLSEWEQGAPATRVTGSEPLLP